MTKDEEKERDRILAETIKRWQMKGGVIKKVKAPKVSVEHVPVAKYKLATGTPPPEPYSPPPKLLKRLLARRGPPIKNKKLDLAVGDMVLVPDYAEGVFHRVEVVSVDPEEVTVRYSDGRVRLADPVWARAPHWSEGQ